MSSLSTTPGDSTTPSEPENSPSGFENRSNPPGSLRENLIKKWGRLKLGDYALQVEKDGRRQQIVERLIRKTQDGTLGKPTTEADDNAAWPESDMAINLGDTTTNVYHQPPQASDGNRGRAFGKAALLVGLLAAGLGGGALAATLLGGKETPARAVTDTDTNTQYGLRLLQKE